MQKILFLGSNPTPDLQLDFMKQFTDLQAIFYASPMHDFTVELAYADAGNLVEILQEHAPDILHFMGHASKAGLAIVGTEHPYQMAPYAVLGDLLERLAKPPRCVVLNACNTGEPPVSLEHAVDFLIGMKGKVHQNASITFADTFYRTLALGEPVGRAFDLATTQMLAEYEGETAKPRLLGRLREEAKTTLLTRRPKLAAEFVLDDRGLPVKSDGYLSVRLFVCNPPEDAYQAIYELPDDYRREDHFNEVPVAQTDFELYIDFWEDFEVRVVLWSPDDGVCLKRHVLDALRERYPKPTDQMEELFHSMAMAMA